MLTNELTELPPGRVESPITRVGDLSAMLRVMRPLNVQMPDPPDPTAGRRRLLADLCRFIGVKVGAVAPESLGFPPDPSVVPNVGIRIEATAVTNGKPVGASGELSPRQEQTLQHLLNGDSEKQVARKLDLSQHTVHSYVKALYRRYGVSSRAELLAKHLKK